MFSQSNKDEAALGLPEGAPHVPEVRFATCSGM